MSTPAQDTATPTVRPTPGQAAYEARYAKYAVDEDWSPLPWEDLEDWEREAWEAAAVASWPTMGAERDALFAENERLRATLERIALTKTKSGTIAREALGGDDA